VWTVLPSPIGELLLVGDGAALTSVWFPSGDGASAHPSPGAGERHDHDPVLVGASRQLTEYFAGRRTVFDLPLATGGTPFQQRVWTALREIPYGTTTSYGEIARRLGLLGGASRAVGLANGSNPISIVIPCHRVIGADGSLTGYGGGLDRKRFLLDLERGALF
jgi:methylated-DNA-[protein]-cysteine S-methyltransferase